MRFYYENKKDLHNCKKKNIFMILQWKNWISYFSIIKSYICNKTFGVLRVETRKYWNKNYTVSAVF